MSGAFPSLYWCFLCPLGEGQFYGPLHGIGDGGGEASLLLDYRFSQGPLLRDSGLNFDLCGVLPFLWF